VLSARKAEHRDRIAARAEYRNGKPIDSGFQPVDMIGAGMEAPEEGIAAAVVHEDEVAILCPQQL
jgi:hypothetical protein